MEAVGYISTIQEDTRESREGGMSYSLIVSSGEERIFLFLQIWDRVIWGGFPGQRRPIRGTPFNWVGRKLSSYLTHSSNKMTARFCCKENETPSYSFSLHNDQLEYQLENLKTSQNEESCLSCCIRLLNFLLMQVVIVV